MPAYPIVDSRINGLKIAAHAGSLPAPWMQFLPRLVEMGFGWIDIPANCPQHLHSYFVDQGLRVSSVALEGGQPPGVHLLSGDNAVRAKSLDYFRRALDLTAAFEADLAYITPPAKTGKGVSDLWSQAICRLADHARSLGIRIAIEHFPGRLLPTASSVLDWLEQVNHDALSLLIDVGHCLISGEDPAAVIHEAGPRLGHLHFDDNDGESDLHWPLFHGRLTETDVRHAMVALRESGYRGALCLELSPLFVDPIEQLRRGQRDLKGWPPNRVPGFTRGY